MLRKRIVLTVIILVGSSFFDAKLSKAQSTSRNNYGFENTFLYEESFNLNKYYDLSLSIVYHQDEIDHSIQVDTIVSKLYGLIAGIHINREIPYFWAQNSINGPLYWSVPLKLVVGSENIPIFSETLDIKGALYIDFNGGLLNHETESIIYTVPALSTIFKIGHGIYIGHGTLMALSLLLMSFHKKINRFWLFIVLLITPVIGPVIYIIDRLLTLLRNFRSRFSNSPVNTQA